MANVAKSLLIILLTIVFIAGFYVILDYVPETTWYHEGWAVVASLIWFGALAIVIIQLHHDGVLLQGEEKKE